MQAGAFVSTEFHFHISGDLHVHTGDTAEILANLNALKGSITMATLTIQELEVKVDGLVSSNAALKSKVDESNDKTDALILVAGAAKDALVAARAELAALQANPAGATAAQLGALGDKIDLAIGSATQAIAAVAAQEGETDAAAAAVAP